MARDANWRLALLTLMVLLVVAAGAFAGERPARISWEAAGMDPALESRVEHLVSRSIDEGNMAGCVVLVGRRAGIVFERAYGHRSVEPETEPMTIDTVFDMASLTKPVATATSVMILLERGQLRLQDKVAKFFPEFAAHEKGNITVEQLLIHSSGLIPDNPLADYDDGWTSAKPMICELKPMAEPGTTFKYSDVGFILLGKIVESVSGKPLNEFAKEEIYTKLGMKDSGYLPSQELKARAATTEKSEGKWLKGEVHDPRAAKMGGVAGHAGLFSTAEDLAIYAQMMLQNGRRGDVQILSPATVEEMIRPRDIDGQQRALGWDHKTGFSRNRGELMSERAFGHGGFTGTVMWIDPKLDLYVIFLSNRLHPDGVGEVNDLGGRIGTVACAGIVERSINDARREARRELVAEATSPSRVGAASGDEPSLSPSIKGTGTVRLGIDVLVADGFKQLGGKRVGLITNHTGVDSSGKTTIDLLHEADNVKLVALFSPEHGIRGTLDQSSIADTVDEKTGLPVYSLYGESRKPSLDQLAELDALVFDIQDIGARFYTYISTMGLAMEAAADAGKEFVVLDRPNPIGGEIIEGPLLDKGRESFTAHHRIPIRHGMTIGELARMFAKERDIDVKLTVVPAKGWRRRMYLYDTGLSWMNPSPNMRSLRAAVLYPGIGMMEFTNISVGRGTDTPFEVMGAPWMRERELANMVNSSNPPGVRVVPLRFTPTSSRFAGEECGGLSFIVTDWDKFRSFELGLTVAHALHELHPKEWDPERWMRLLGNEEVYRRVLAGEEMAEILKSIDEQVSEFRERRKVFELYE
ncbi:MAG: exo-beta-N-acetylmuramidase NamZ domain-containing protein [Pirellulales bacterium]